MGDRPVAMPVPTTRYLTHASRAERDEGRVGLAYVALGQTHFRVENGLDQAGEPLVASLQTSSPLYLAGPL